MMLISVGVKRVLHAIWRSFVFCFLEFGCWEGLHP